MLTLNQSFDVWHDALGSLAEEDATAASGNGAALSELQSFTDMNYSQGRCVAALQWVPARKVQASPQLSGSQSPPKCSSQVFYMPTGIALQFRSQNVQCLLQ